MIGKIIETGMFGDPPKILGIDVAGVIEEVGPDVKGYKKGDRMYASLSLSLYQHRIPLYQYPQQSHSLQTTIIQ